MIDLNLPKKLSYPTYNFNLKSENNITFIFDEIRKKWLVLTPEEWVRQHIVFYLVDQKGYPASLIGVEKTVVINTRKKRFDIVCFNNRAEPILIIECKAPEIVLQRTTIEQVNRYNEVIGAAIMMITNGIDTYLMRKNSSNNTISYLNEIPHYKDFI